mmetsp:Transcript_32868/g.37646  ORF Transcript_32868/g.37646 Transcript_32868/m.37646 type:complete len:90 (-) Transcript_32868:1526-1795(-)
MQAEAPYNQVSQVQAVNSVVQVAKAEQKSRQFMLKNGKVDRKWDQRSVNLYTSNQNTETLHEITESLARKKSVQYIENTNAHQDSIISK